MSGETFSFKKYSFIFAGKRITGFAKDTGIEWEADDDSFISDIGADGEKSRSATNVTSGKFKISLKQTSLDNQRLSNIHNTDIATLQGKFPVSLIDGNGTTAISSNKGWIMRWANITLGKEITGREWTIEHASAAINIGGNF